VAARTLLLSLSLSWGCQGDPSPQSKPETGTSADTATVVGDTATDPPPTPGPLQADLSPHPQIATVVTAAWVQPVDADSVWISWSVGGEARTSPAVPRSAGPQREVLLGTPPQTQVSPVLHWVVGGEEGSAALGDITTGALPEELVAPTLVLRDAARARPEPWLLTSVDAGFVDFFGPFFAVILDAEGRVVWYRQTSELRMSWQVEAHDGFVTIDASTVYRGSEPEILRTTLDLAQIEAVALPGFAQSYTQLDDGTILFQETASPYAFWLSRRNPDGSRDRLWDCNAWMDAWRDDYWACAANTITFHPDRGTALYSMFVTDTVVEIDVGTGALLREFGSFPGGFDFDPPDTTFRHQHLPTFTPDGTLLTQTDDPTGQTQWAREYEIDDASGTLREIWSVQTGHFAEYAGQAQPLPSGNVLWQHGTAGSIEELTRGGEVVWAVDWAGHLTGNATPVADLYALNGGW
jgi:hypothetical protein